MQKIKNGIIGFELVDWRKIQDLQPDTFKIKVNYEKLKTSLLNNGFIAPFYLWRENETLWCADGHQRVKVLKELSETVEIPDLLPAIFIHAENATEAAQAILIYSARYGEISENGLQELMNEYQISNSFLEANIELPDFDMARFVQDHKLYDTNVENIEDSQIIVKDTFVKKGDLFELGTTDREQFHRLICEDFKKNEVLEMLMQSQKVRLMHHDPPYNLPTNFFSGKGKVKHEDFHEAAGEMTDEEFVEYIALIYKNSLSYLLDGGLLYIWIDHKHSWHILEAARRHFGSPTAKQMAVWNKMLPANGSFYRSQHELCFIFKNGNAKHFSNLELSQRNRSNVWDFAGANSFANPDRERNGQKFDSGALESHPTPKNSDMYAEILLDVTEPQNIVVDFFCGSGTSIIAAEKTDRTAYCTEISPKYVHSIILRYIRFCQKQGKEPVIRHLNGDLTINSFLE